MLSILPDADVRQKCLTLFADALAEANASGRDRWAITHTKDKVRLIVGHIVVCTLQNHRVWMTLDKGLLEVPSPRSRLERSADWEWEVDAYPEYHQVPSKNGYYWPSEKHEQVWPELRRLHYRAIYRAATETTMDPKTPQRHSPEILRYLRNGLGRHMPDPLY